MFSAAMPGFSPVAQCATCRTHRENRNKARIRSDVRRARASRSGLHGGGRGGTGKVVPETLGTKISGRGSLVLLERSASIWLRKERVEITGKRKGSRSEMAKWRREKNVAYKIEAVAAAACNAWCLLCLVANVSEEIDGAAAAGRYIEHIRR